MERPDLMSHGYAVRGAYTTVGWPAITTLAVPLLLGCFAVYVYKIFDDEQALLIAALVLAVGLMTSVALTAFDRGAVSIAASGVALVDALSLFLILSPLSGFIYADAIVLFGGAMGALLLHRRFARLPSIGASRLRESSVAVVLFLPMVLAMAQSMFLGLRFWESYPIGRTSLLFIPLLAVWGYAEEGLFRGILQRSVLPLLGGGGSVLFTSALYSAFTLFWGSLPYAIFSFLFGLLIGWIYLRSRSLMYVGTVHALMDTWMIIAYIALGIVIP